MSALRGSFWVKLVLSSIAIILFFLLREYTQQPTLSIFKREKAVVPSSLPDPPGSWSHELTSLLEAGVYNQSDFKNNAGISPPYWSEGQNYTELPTSMKEWGPCYRVKRNVDWNVEIAKNYTNGTIPQYPKTSGKNVEPWDLANNCRPGFLIIGAGKCGTSSLYHYITGHPRVLPASEKQIHYFKYYADHSMNWYLHHFPTTVSFLSSGALITGEASPGYLPYPKVATLVKERLPTNPRIVAIGREPVDRAYSSYRYNYVAPAMDAMREGKIGGIPLGLGDDFYKTLLFSFEEMVVAELGILRKCLSVPSGSAVAGARMTWGNQPWTKPEFERREKLNLEPLVDLDGFCYGGKVNNNVLREQWVELKERNPSKVIPPLNVHLIQSIVGRGLYVLPLEWWYAVFDKSDIYFLCTEELTDMSGEPINKLGQFLGLPSYNFSSTVSQGAFNVGGHKGYDTEISWSDLEEESANNSVGVSSTIQEVPLSIAIRQELDEFYQPYNDRLFDLVGRGCAW